MALRTLTRTAAMAVQSRLPLMIASRGLVGKARRGEVERPKPFPQDKRDFTVLDEVLDRTTSKWDDGTKVIVVDGAHAIGKTKLASELAQEFDMKLFSHPRVSDMYINYYGEDMNDYAPYFTPVNKPYDERDFSRNPTGPVEGSGDRFHMIAWMEKYRNYVYALKHLYNTGQGVVVEGNPFSDYAHFEAAFNQGWIDRTTRVAYKESRYFSEHLLLRPHVIVYLDAPADVVMKNIKARNNPWDKESPVWTNKRYLNDIYNEKKRRYLMEQQRHSNVMVYDWSTPGETDIVVDDIEKLDLDYVDEYDDLLRDWTRNRTEQLHTILRRRYCNMGTRSDLLALLGGSEEFMEADALWKTVEDDENMNDVLSFIKSERYAPGANAAMGDKNIWARINWFSSVENLPRYYERRLEYTRTWLPFEEEAWLEPVKATK